MASDSATLDYLRGNALAVFAMSYVVGDAEDQGPAPPMPSISSTVQTLSRGRPSRAPSLIS